MQNPLRASCAIALRGGKARCGDATRPRRCTNDRTDEGLRRRPCLSSATTWNAEGLAAKRPRMRDEPNAVGVPTKHQPSRRAEAYFSDADFAAVKPAIDAAMMRLAEHPRAGGQVVRPADGIGTGLADLERRVPRIPALPGTLSQSARTPLAANAIGISLVRVGCPFGAWPTLPVGHRALLAKACGGAELHRRPKLAEPNSPAGRPCYDGDGLVPSPPPPSAVYARRPACLRPCGSRSLARQFDERAFGGSSVPSGSTARGGGLLAVDS